MNTPLAEGIPWGISLRQPTEDFCIRFFNRTQAFRINGKIVI
jgi:hypothetical protein